MADDASDYPAALDTFTTLPALRDGPPTESDYHDKYQDALVNIETELGVNVRHRLGRTFADETARDAAITSPVLGDRAFLTNRSFATFYNGSAWWPIPEIAAKESVVTFTAGVGTIAFGRTFSAIPIVTAMVVTGGAGVYSLHSQGTNTTGSTLYCTSGGVAAAGPLGILWHAINAEIG